MEREWLNQRADSNGECDRCHQDRPLWTDTENPGEFSYCRKCWLAIMDRKVGKESDLPERLRPE